MKVLIVRSFPNKLDTNSYNVQELGLANALKKRGIECGIVFYNAFSKSYIEQTNTGITIYWLKSLNIIKNGLFVGLSKIVKNYDVIQVHEYDQLQSWLIYTFSKKKVIIYHGPYYDSFNKGYNLKCMIFDFFFLPFSYKAKNNTTCLTKSPSAAIFLTNKGFKKVHSVGVGLDTSRFENNEYRYVPNTDSDSFTALYVGKLEERRNISFLLELADIIHNKYHRFKLTIIGNYDNNEYKSKIAPTMQCLQNKGVINHFESINQKDLPAYYTNADIFLFTTNYDIFGMVLLEAMYYGCVPVSTVNGGSTTLISHKKDGFLMKNFQAGDWEAIILDLINNRERLLSMKANAHDKIANKFTWDSIATKFIYHYQN